MKRYLILFFFLLPFLVSGCGEETAPSDATITISPTKVEYTGALAGNATHNITVVVKNASGYPLGNIEIQISGALAAPRTPARYQFYKKPNGVEAVDSGFSAITDENGTYNFSIIIYATVNGSSSTFTDNLEVRSGSAFNSISLSITAS